MTEITQINTNFSDAPFSESPTYTNNPAEVATFVQNAETAWTWMFEKFKSDVNDPNSFKHFLNALNAFISQTNQLAEGVEQSEHNADSSAQNAATSEQNASTSAQNAATSEQSSQSSAEAAQASAAELANYASMTSIERALPTKAEFEALATERRANRAGSGFDTWGKHSDSSNVNDGIFTGNSSTFYSNSFGLGKYNGDGDSRSDYPIANVNGYLLHILGIQYTDNTWANKISLPDAPSVTHVDSSNSGLVVNGDFNSLVGWSDINALLLISNDRIEMTSISSSWPTIQQNFTDLIVGKKYVIEVTAESATMNARIQAGTPTQATEYAYQNLSDGLNKFEFTATDTTMHFKLQGYATEANQVCYFSKASIFPTDEVSRSDLVFLEVWHEDVSDKNFVYPYGNTQYRGLDTDGLNGIANGSFAGKETYSLFGNWQEDNELVGKGYVWSNLTEEEKVEFVSNHRNNCYIDGNNIIQVRYRVRVVKGLGDDWNNAFESHFYRSNTNRYVSYALNSKFIHTKGNQTNIPSDYTDVYSYGMDFVDDGNNGQWSGRQDYGYDLIRPVAIPIALVHRRNKGTFHPLYNPNGASRWKHVASFNTYGDWYMGDPMNDILTTVDAITPHGAEDGEHGYSGGAIGSDSGRPDGLFYDEVHESDITDLRMNSKKVSDLSRLLDKEFNRAISGETRGSEGEWELYKVKSIEITERNYSSGSSILPPGATWLFNPSFTNQSFGGSKLEIVDDHKVFVSSDGQYYEVFYIENNGFIWLHPKHGNVASEFDLVTEYEIIFTRESTRKKSNTMLHCDIIGDPANYPDEWKNFGFTGTPLLVGEDGEDYLDAPYTLLDQLKASKKNVAELLTLYSDDNGVTWTAGSNDIDTETNMFTGAGYNLNTGTRLWLVFYITHANMTKPTANSEVLTLGDVFVNNRQEASRGGLLVSALIGKVAVGMHGQPSFLPISQYRVSQHIGNELYDWTVQPPTHNDPLLYGEETPAVKTLAYLSKDSNKAYLNLVFKEMRFDTTWGDDNNFNIVDNVNTTTDDNGNTILIGQKRIELPFFIKEDE